MNLVQIQEHLKGMPAQALMAYANGMNPSVPPYLALGELNRRKMVEQNAQKMQSPQGTVKDQIENETGLMALKKQAMDQMQLGALRQQQMAQGQAAQSANQPQAVPAGAPQPEMQEEVAMADGGIAQISVPDFATSYGSGGIVAFANRGLVEDDEETALDRKRRAREAAENFLRQQYEEKKAKQQEETPARSGADLPDVEMPAPMDNSIPGFVAGTPYSDAMRRAAPAAPAPQPSMADQIPGQKYVAPASTGQMPGELERNIRNTMAALPGASAVRAAPTGIRALAPYLAALAGVQEPTPEVERGRPTMANDPRLVTPQNVEPEVERGRPTMANDPRLVGIANALNAVAQNRNAPQPAPQASPVAAPAAARPVGIAGTSVAQPAQPAQVAQPAGPNFLQMLADQATGKGQQTYEEKMAAAEAKDPYLKKQPGELIEQYLQRMQDRQAKEESRQAEMEKDRTRAGLWRSLIAAGEASRGQRGIGALMAGFGRTAGEELEAGRVREEAQMKARREFEDNMAKMRQEIENARIARAQGRFKDANEHEQKAQESKNKAIEKGAEIQSTEQRDAQKFAHDEKLAQIRFEYEKKLKGIPQAERPTLEREYVEQLVKNGIPRDQAIERAKMLGNPSTKGVMTRDQAEDNFRKDMENFQLADSMRKEAESHYGRKPSYSEMKEYFIQKQMGASKGAAPSSGVTRPITQAEFDKLPSGARYINPADGKEYIKK